MSNNKSLDNLKPGSVLHIPNFNLQNKEGGDKPVWMLYLGKDSIFDCPIFLHLHRYTTQLQHYESGGIRANHQVLKFTNPPYTFFKAEQCILDFNERPYSIDQVHFERTFWPNCSVVGELDEQKIREICNCIRRSQFYNKNQKTAIRNSLNKIGISGINL